MSEPAPLVLRVSGVPAPQGSKSPFVVWPKGGKPRAVITEGKRGSPQRRKLDAWLAAIATAATDQAPGHQPFAGPVKLRAIFYLERPKSYPGWRWLPWVKPDVDKLCRSTLDGLTAAKVYGDDAQVVELSVRKVYALGRPTGALIEVSSLAAEEERQGHAWDLAGGPSPRL